MLSSRTSNLEPTSVSELPMSYVCVGSVKLSVFIILEPTSEPEFCYVNVKYLLL